jgi:ACR3 family arsenite efflux pump ArsB
MISLFGSHSRVARAMVKGVQVEGVLEEVPVMLSLVYFADRAQFLFKH